MFHGAFTLVWDLLESTAQLVGASAHFVLCTSSSSLCEEYNQYALHVEERRDEQPKGWTTQGGCGGAMLMPQPTLSSSVSWLSHSSSTATGSRAHSLGRSGRAKSCNENRVCRELHSSVRMTRNGRETGLSGELGWYQLERASEDMLVMEMLPFGSVL